MPGYIYRQSFYPFVLFQKDYPHPSSIITQVPGTKGLLTLETTIIKKRTKGLPLLPGVNIYI